MELTRVSPALDLYDESWPIWTYQEQLPPAKFIFDEDGRRGAAVDSMVSGGCIISGSTVKCSLLFSSVRVHSYCSIDGAVFCRTSRSAAALCCIASSSIADAHPPGLQVGVDPEEDRKRFHVTNKGITLVTPEMLGQQLHHLR